MKKTIIVLCLLGFCWTGCFAQIQLKYLSAKKETYQPNDKIELLVNLKTLPETCRDGLDRAKIYVSGLTIDNQSDWKKITTTIWQKQLQLTIQNTSKKEAKLTILRKVDKENLFCQEFFKISN